MVARRLMLLLIALLLAAPVVVAPSALAQEGVVNKLLAPGPLMDGHKNLEHGDCLKCHDAGSGVPDSKCLSCHSTIKKSIATGDSFHANAGKPCITCHTDHKGRDFNSTKVNQSTFSHNKTGFHLNGAHTKIGCAKCHTDLKDGQIHFFGKDDSCKSCHIKQSPHNWPPKIDKKECNACHSETTWKGLKFDHKRETGYALVGDHAKLTCEKCHGAKGKAAKYDFPGLATKQCLTCHQDQHAGHMSKEFSGGSKCVTCHNQESWDIASFDHARITGYDLKGAHSKLACVSCHKQASGASKPDDKRFEFAKASDTCNACHKDYHGFGPEKSDKLGPLSSCASCHGLSAWKQSLKFNHDRDTSYPITGRHRGVACFDCHKPKSGNGNRPYEFPALETKTCELCHKSAHADMPATSVFKSQKCTACHTTDGWHIQKGGAKGFNHDLNTRFPLTGRHTSVKCEKCHAAKGGGGKQSFKFPGVEKKFCENCHKSPHTKQFEPKFLQESCASCHNTTDWKNFKFDHSKTNFKHTGAHLAIAQQCEKCHVKKKYQFGHKETGYCTECHKSVHGDQFSSRVDTSDCRRCHTTKAFDQLLSFDHDKTRFRLTGAHTQLAAECERCHVKTNKMLATKPPKPAGKYQFADEDNGFCLACHKNVHKEQFTKKFSQLPCRDCHSTKAFEPRKPFDHSQTDFKLTGAHLHIKQKCAQCHVATQTMLKTDPPKAAGKYKFKHESEGFCESCHKNEHKSQFHAKFSDKPCTECHTTAHFNKRRKFDHNHTRFVLKEKHLEVACADCHKATAKRFTQGTKSKKGTYIFADLKSKDCNTCHEDPHDGKFGKQCSNCHTEAGWDETASYHKNMMLSGVHYMVGCPECHGGDRKELAGTGLDCKTCHMKDDIHLGSQPECQTCHNQQFWSVSRFQHGLTGFPLRGAHRLQECSACHAGGIYDGRSSECISCHFEDSLRVVTPDHKSSAFEDCGSCHNQFMFGGAK